MLAARKRFEVDRDPGPVARVHTFPVIFCREEEIRTLDTVARIHTFQACSFNHSDTSLCQGCKYNGFSGRIR
jgi:hypothetical protein